MHETARNTRISLIVLACLILNGSNNPNSKVSTNNFDSSLKHKIYKKKSSAKAKQIRKDWFEKIHNGDVVDWRSMEYQNMLDKYKTKSEIEEGRELGCVEIAGGKLIGKWQEMGPTNWAGDIKRVAYSEEQDRIFAISAGHTIWKGKLDGSEWQVVNDDLRFDHDILEIVVLEDGSELIFASMDGKLAYSDDGNLWSFADGLGFDADVNQMNILKTGEIFILSKPSESANVGLYKSKFTNGSIDPKNYEKQLDFQTKEISDIAIALSPNKVDLYAIRYNLNENKILTYKRNLSTGVIELKNSFQTSIINNYPKDKARLVVSTNPINNTIKLQRPGRSRNVYKSTDLGQQWLPDNTLREEPWEDAYSILSDGQTQIMGREQCYYLKAGTNWELVNRWEDYYPDPENNLHIDIMQIKEFKKGNKKFVLICTHGGIYYTEDITQGVTNISLKGLNNTQFYDVVSIEEDPNWIFAGSQDQGWQRGRIGSADPPFEFLQILSGDYGHLKINEDFGLWASYPEGEIRYFRNVITFFDEDDNGTNEADLIVKIANPQDNIWISPIMLDPNPASGNTIIVAGGSTNENDTGSYLISIQRQNSGAFEIRQRNYDFSNGGEVSALAIDPNDHNKWYAASSEGKFYYSLDAGESFIKVVPDVPNSHNLYGSHILVSKNSPGTLYVCGSGYLTSSILKSTDGGLTFQDFTNELPSTTVFELATNENENLIFAATEAGPYVYLKATEKWHDLASFMAPNQPYWSVDYIESISTVRFGTYGRGVWDFKIEEFTSIENTNLANPEANVYPNPSSEILRIDTEFFGNISHYEVLTLEGNFIFGGEITTLQDKSIPVAQLATGAYLLRLRHKEGNIFKKFVKI